MKEGQAISMPVCSEFTNHSGDTRPFYTNMKHLNPVVLLERLHFYKSGADTKAMIARTCYEPTDERTSSNIEISQPVQDSRDIKNTIEVKAWETISSSYIPPSLNVHDLQKLDVTFPNENSANTEIAKAEGRVFAREQLLELSRTEEISLTKDYFDGVTSDARDPLFITTNKLEDSPKDLTSGCRNYLQLVTNLRKEGTENKASNVFPESTFPQDNMNLQEIYTQRTSFSGNKSELISKEENVIYHQKTHMRSYECQECQRKFSRKRYLRKHIATHTQVRSFECQTCKKKFKMKDHLRKHMKIHVDYKHYCCKECSKYFSQKSYLIKHMRTHTLQQRRFQCKDCGKKFLTKLNFETHSRIHSGLVPFVCHCCPKKFTDRSNLRKHTRVHTGEKPFKCNDCAKMFSTKVTLLGHTIIHTREKRFKCEECKRKFSLKKYLVEHISTHRDEKNYECHECRRKFSRKPHLENHMRIHTGERPFTCDICKKTFSNKCNWKFHIQIHAGDNCYECEECGKRFALKYYLTSHIKFHRSKKSAK